MNITISHLRAIDAVARTGQFSKAAQLLGLSQPTVSTQVQAFEGLSSIRIFIREGYSVRVAPGAETLLGKIRLALNSIEEVEREARDPAGLNSGKISIGFSAHRLIMPVLTSFVEQFPNMQVSTHGGPSLDLVEAVTKGELDIASISQTAPDPRFYNLELKRCPLIVYGQKGHPLLKRNHLKMIDLDCQNMILWNRASGTRNLLEQLGSAAGITLRVIMEVATLDVAYAAAASGIGLAVAIEGEVLADSHIDIAYLEADAADIGHYLITQPEAVQLGAVAAFIEVALARIGEVSGQVPK